MAKDDKRTANRPAHAAVAVDRAPDDRRRALIVSVAFVVVSVVWLFVWNWGMPEWKDIPSVRLDLLLNGSNASLSVKGEADIKLDFTTQNEVFHESNQLDLMSRYPLTEKLSLTDLVVIPGLSNTLSYDHVTRGTAMSHNMVPQGVAVSDKWIFLSSYDGDKTVNSVVYMIDRASGALEKAVILDGQPHAGGLAFDPTSNTLWVCTRRSKKAELSSIKLSALEAYDESSGKAIDYDSNVIINGPKRASFVEYYDGSLYVGFFNAKDIGQLYRYQLTEDGRLEEAAALEPAQTWDIPKKAQGAVITDGYVLISQSHGNGASQMSIYHRDGADGRSVPNYLDENAIATADLPPMMEDLTSNGSEMFAAFESGANVYRNRYGVGVDRIVSYSLDELQKAIERNTALYQQKNEETKVEGAA